MGFSEVYDETKAIAQNFRANLMNALVTEKFRKMLDAISTSISLSNTVRNSIPLEARQFFAFDNPTSIVVPQGVIDVVNSYTPKLTAKWTGNTILKLVNDEYVKLLPISEMTYEPENIVEFKKEVSDKLNKLPVVIAVEISDPNYPPSDADFHDYRYAYYLPEQIDDYSYLNSKYGLGNKANVYLSVEVGFMIGATELVAFQLDYVQGAMYKYKFGNIGNVSNVEFDVWFRPIAKLNYQTAGGQQSIVIQPDVVIYHYTPLNKSYLRVGDYPLFSCGSGGGMYMIAVQYSLTEGWLFLGTSPTSMP